MHLMREMYRDVTDINTVEVPEESFDTTFIRHLTLSIGETSRRNERVNDLHEYHAEYRFNDTRCNGDADIYEYSAMKYLTSLENNMIMILERFKLCSFFALCPGLSRKGIWSIINRATNDCRNQQEIEFVDKKASRRSRNEASVIRAAIQEHRAVFGLLNPEEKLSEMKKRMLSTHSTVFRLPEPRTRTQGGDGAGYAEKCRVVETKGCASGEALRFRYDMQQQVTLCGNQLQRPSWHHERDLSGVQCQEDRDHRRKTGTRTGRISSSSNVSK